MNKKAQGAIEYLLIIGAAILFVAIVIAVIASGVTQGKNQGAAGEADRNTQMQKLDCLKDCKTLDANCAIDHNNSCAARFPLICGASGSACVKK